MKNQEEDCKRQPHESIKHSWCSCVEHWTCRRRRLRRKLSEGEWDEHTHWDQQTQLDEFLVTKAAAALSSQPGRLSLLNHNINTQRRDKTAIGDWHYLSLAMHSSKEERRHYQAVHRFQEAKFSNNSRIDEILDRHREAQLLSKLYLSKDFHQVPVRPKDVEKTAFVTQFRKFD